MKNIIRDNTMYLEDVILSSLPENFKCRYSLDCNNSSITQLPNGLEVCGDLIIGNAYIEDLPSGLIVFGDIHMEEKDIPLPKDALVGGQVYDKNGVYTPVLHTDHYIKADDGKGIFYKKSETIISESDLPLDYYYPKILFYKNLNPKENIHIVEYTENGITYRLSCDSLSDGVNKVNWNRAKINGIDRFKDYDIDEPRTVEELKQIYQVCTGACESGIVDFMQKYNIDKNKLYSIRQLRFMVMNMKITAGRSKSVFLEYFDPKKKEAN